MRRLRSARPELALLLLGACALPLAGHNYMGSASCAPCHGAESATQSKSHHAAALHPMTGSQLEARLLQANHSSDGFVSYQPRPDGVLAEAANGGRALLTWAFGAGAQGMTAVGRPLQSEDGALLEHRYSAYTKSGNLALTFGHPAKPTPEASGLGIRQDERTVRRCFACHSVVQPSGLPSPLEAGVRCERCHGPGAEHIQAVRMQRPVAEIRKALLNPGRLPARAEVEVCGSCHRLPSPDSGDEPELEDPITVRFAPVGLMASRCFRESTTLRCTTCHNPHENVRPASSLGYRDQCLTCHAKSTQAVKHCRRLQKENCLPCHMHKASLSADLSFTDHRIRIYR